MPFIHKVPVEKLRFFVGAPRKNVRVVRNCALFIRCTIEKKRCCTVFSTVSGSARTIVKSGQWGSAPNRTVGFVICENRTEPHRTVLWDFQFFNTAPNRKLEFPILQNRTEPHRRIYHSPEPHRRIYDV